MQAYLIHDKVYGLLAISTDCGSRGTPVNYSAPVSQLYMDIMKVYNQHHRLDPSFCSGSQLVRLSQLLQSLLGLILSTKQFEKTTPEWHIAVPAPFLSATAY